MLSLTPTSASMNITQHEASLSMDECIVSLMLADADTQLCPEEGVGEREEEGNGVITIALLSAAVEFVNLSEFSVYNMTVDVQNNDYRASASFSYEFSTLSSGT